MPSSTAEMPKIQLLNQVVAAAQEMLAAGPPQGREGGQAIDAADLEWFIRECYDSIAPDDLLDRDPRDLAGAALDLWRFGAVRQKGELLLEVFNPNREQNGWDSSRTTAFVVNDDMPFLVDSVTAELNRMNHPVQLVIHPQVGVRRGPDGGDRSLVTDRQSEEVVRESYMQVEVERIFEEEERRRVEEALASVLRDVRVAVDDWQPMLARLEQLIEELRNLPGPVLEVVDRDELEEVITFLAWLEDNNFTFLGYREFDIIEQDGDEYLRPVEGSSLGVLRVREEQGDQRLRPLTPKMSRYARRPQVLLVTKANHRSTVHRPSHMDYLGIKRFDPETGEVVGERRFLGLFTSAAYSRQAKSIPLLRTKVERTLQRADFPADSHDGKALAHILETFPRDELFQISENKLYDISRGILQLQERQRIALFVRRDPFERFVSCLVYAPRDRYNTSLRIRMQGILERALNGKVTTYDTSLSDSPLARVHYFVKTTPGEVPTYDVKAIEGELVEAARSWRDELKEELLGDGVEEPPTPHQVELFKRYRRAFPSYYRERFEASDALLDIERAETVRATRRLVLGLSRDDDGGAHTLRLKIYHPGRALALSDTLPLLENMALRVVSEIPHSLTPAEGEPVWIHDFVLESLDGGPLDLERLRTTLPTAFIRTWEGFAENDGFNRLVVRAGLAWDEVVVLRAYAKYLRQAGGAFSQAYIQETLAARPNLAQLLVELFLSRFDPAQTPEAEHRMEEIQVRVQEALEAVRNPDEDRIFRKYLNLIKNTVRTNFFQRGEDGEPKAYLSFKLDPAEIEDLPDPRPWREIYVYSPRVEAVHLRGGPVARGGIRWSDRREDFRKEVLDLMKAQMVKNAVIVPVGSKGGFVVKQPPIEGGREALQKEARACYSIMMRGLLDLTDNLVDGRLVPPPQLVRRERVGGDPLDDPYLVVAADKGTATFSDLANEISADYGFWLGDAFASGGTYGYDHKAMGITAKGAWEAVKRHFRELGTDIQKEDFTVVGVGDMSGDVFGNGMLLSRHIRLLGAFNHLHIFVDPDPDPERSYAERERLFALPNSTWQDYSEDALSAGGRVFDRQERTLELTPEIQRAVGLKEETVTPDELIRALLRSPVDLLWFGGIGTYVKGSTESHSDVEDRANDKLRVNAPELRARVVGEGANLGVTQRARIEFALGGGKINTDAIDNSGGVDASDHEVNIKILLDEVVARGELERDARNELLAAMTDEVAGLVLRDNYLQTQALSVTESRGAELLDAQERMIRSLERRNRLDRRLEVLPDDETLADRRQQGVGLTRPELAVLLAYGKIALYENLLSSSLLEDPLLLGDLSLYFPQPLRERYGDAIQDHRLRHEIIATYVTNSMVNRVGPTFVFEMEEETGLEPADVARAYTIAREAYELRTLWAAIETLDNRVPAEAQIGMIQAIGSVVERVTLWLLRNGSKPLDIQEVTAGLRPVVSILGDSLGEILTPAQLRQVQRRAKPFVKQGVEPDLAWRVASLGAMATACDIWRIARQGGWPIKDIGRLYYRLGDHFHLALLRLRAAELPVESRWEKAARSALLDSLASHQSALTLQILEASDEPLSDRRAISRWEARVGEAVAQPRALLAELTGVAQADLAQLITADDVLRRLVARSWTPRPEGSDDPAEPAAEERAG